MDRRQFWGRWFGAAGVLLALLLCVGCAAPRATGNYALEDVRNLDTLRQEALSLVNRERRAQGLTELRASGPINAAAQAHAEDMARRGFYDHLSPERHDVVYRYRANGGGLWNVIGENIVTCNSCTPDAAQVRNFHERWMRSPGHRTNILRQGIRSFGFGVAAANGKVYAVQTFVGERE